MHSLTVVVAQSDCIVAEHMAATLHAHFHNVVVARDLDEVRHSILKNRADVVIFDLDLAGLAEVQTLLNDFRVRVVCTHRIPDDEMWRECLDVGAVDCCPCDDIPAIICAARRCQRSFAAHAA